MNIYVVNFAESDYDEYDCFVLVADSEDSALGMLRHDDALVEYGWRYTLWANRVRWMIGDKPNKVEVVCVGVAAARYSEPVILVASYNAG